MALFRKAALTALFLTVCLSGTTFAQKANFNVSFQPYLDNREYKPAASEIPQTMFGFRLTPYLNIVKHKHSLRLGMELHREFANTDCFFIKHPIIMYSYKSRHFNAFAGSMENNLSMGDYQGYIESDSIGIYDAIQEGFLFQLHGRDRFVEIGCNWLGRETDESRERFLVFSAGEIKGSVISMSYTATMMHFAGSRQVRGVVDLYTVSPRLTLTVFNHRDIHSLNLFAEYVQTFQQDRKYCGYYIFPKGIELGVRYNIHNVGIENTCYFGDNLMPYFNTKDETGKNYGTDLYRGELFYSTDGGFYDRLEVY